MLETRQRFLRVAHYLGLQAFNNRKLFCCAAGFWRHPQAALTQTTFRKRLEHVERGDHVEKLSAIL